MDTDQLIERAIRTSGTLGSLRAPGTAEIIASHVSLYYDYPIPIRTIVSRVETIAGYVDTLESIKLDPGIPQRTAPWYAARERMVTGSELENAINDSKKRQFFKRKLAGPEGWNDLKDNPAIKWGVKYEPVAIKLYERRSGAKVYEFGLLPHKNIIGFGASPDGISDMGIMLEIKCPYSRTITGEVPSAYFAQVQAQMDTTRLRECDFLECKFAEYNSPDDYLNDCSPDDPSLTSRGMEKGVVWQSEDSDVHEVYIGPDAAKWAETRPGACFWKLLVYNRVRVQKEDAFVERLRPSIEQAITKIAEYRDDPSAIDRDYPPKQDPWNLPSFAFK